MNDLNLKVSWQTDGGSKLVGSNPCADKGFFSHKISVKVHLHKSCFCGFCSSFKCEFIDCHVTLELRIRIKITDRLVRFFAKKQVSTLGP